MPTLTDQVLIGVNEMRTPHFKLSLGKLHIDCDNAPRRGECCYLCMYLAVCSVCRLNVAENTPSQSITHSARARW